MKLLNVIRTRGESPVIDDVHRMEQRRVITVYLLRLVKALCPECVVEAILRSGRLILMRWIPQIGPLIILSTQSVTVVIFTHFLMCHDFRSVLNNNQEKAIKRVKLFSAAKNMR